MNGASGVLSQISASLNFLAPGKSSGDSHRQCVRSTNRALFAATVALVSGLAAFQIYTPHFAFASVIVAIVLWAAICRFVRLTLTLHPYDKFGLANYITLARALATTLLASAIPVASQLAQFNHWLWAISLTATISLCLDGLDGYVARKWSLVSDMGARFDMEVDALLSFVIVLFLWQSGELGIWILALGLMRYVFLAASVWLPELKAELYPSLRRKTVCVVQVAALCLMICPLLTHSQILITGLIAFALLMYSFAVDTLWLLGYKERTPAA